MFTRGDRVEVTGTAVPSLTGKVGTVVRVGRDSKLLGGVTVKIDGLKGDKGHRIFWNQELRLRRES